MQQGKISYNFVATTALQKASLLLWRTENCARECFCNAFGKTIKPKQYLGNDESAVHQGEGLCPKSFSAQFKTFICSMFLPVPAGYRTFGLLGHSNINTTRIYTQTSGEEHLRQIEQLHLIL